MCSNLCIERVVLVNDIGNLTNLRNGFKGVRNEISPSTETMANIMVKC